MVVDDDDPDSAALLTFYLDPNDQPLDGDETLLASGLPEDPDDDQDEFWLTVRPTCRPGSIN